MIKLVSIECINTGKRLLCKTRKCEQAADSQQLQDPAPLRATVPVLLSSSLRFPSFKDGPNMSVV